LSGYLGNPEVPSQLVAAAVAEFGGLDALVANAGIASPGAICDLSIEDWDEMFSVNLRGAWLLANALVLKEAFRLIGVDNGFSQKPRYLLEESVTHEPC
jgi:NAD(P)-dependent dehydrogenase (short-subunit alcohol dehydrogenase family)